MCRERRPSGSIGNVLAALAVIATCVVGVVNHLDSRRALAVAEKSLELARGNNTSGGSSSSWDDMVGGGDWPATEDGGGGSSGTFGEDKPSRPRQVTDRLGLGELSAPSGSHSGGTF